LSFLPATSAVDLVRFRLGDVEPSNPLCSDEEILQALTDEHQDSWLAAATIAESKALSFLMRPTSEKRGERVVSYAAQAEAFQAFAQRIRLNASIRTTTIYAGGISEAEKQAARFPSDDVRPYARTRLHDSPWPAVSDAERWD
jgi:hypothetical protein